MEWGRSRRWRVSFYLVEDGEIKAQYIIENETRLKRRQILRKASYQGGAYRGQLESGRPVYPVISLVIDWTGKSTRIPLSLHGLLAKYGVPEEDLLLADDMKMKVYHMHNLSWKVRKCFTSDLGFVADYLNTGSFDGRRRQKIIHVQSLCEMMEALTGDERFTDMTVKLVKKQKERKGIYMCEYIDMLEARGEVRGESRLAALLDKLYSLGRDEDAKLAVRDENARKQLYKEFCIAN